jgi:hypothetical protein
VKLHYQLLLVEGNSVKKGIAVDRSGLQQEVSVGFVRFAMGTGVCA